MALSWSLNPLSGIGRSADSYALLIPPATSGLTSFLVFPLPMDSAGCLQTVTHVLTVRLGLLSLERRDAWNERKKNEI